MQWFAWTCLADLLAGVLAIVGLGWAGSPRSHRGQVEHSLRQLMTLYLSHYGAGGARVTNCQ